MTTYYVGPGGSDASDGLTWANRFLTLNGAEDEPVAASDTVYVGPGVYREKLTCDVSGTSGNLITYIGDHTGEKTDDVGGTVRITGSDDDQSATRVDGILVGSISYRTFRGFQLDIVTGSLVDINGATNIVIEDCSFQHSSTSDGCIQITGAGQSDITIRRCIFFGGGSEQIEINHSVTGVDNANHLVENCLFMAANTDAIRIARVGDVVIKNCTFSGIRSSAVQVSTSPTAAHPAIVNNSIFNSCNIALDAATSGDITEDYNALSENITDRINVSVGSNSNTYPPLFLLPNLLSGLRPFVSMMGYLSQWSQLARIAGTGEATNDMFDLARPTVSAKKSWGSIQAPSFKRETATVRSGIASALMSDAGRHQFIVPCRPISTTVSVYVYRETNYTGTLPQIVIKQAGVADQTTVDTGAVDTWNLLTDTFTPDAATDYFIVELVSNNTATAGGYDVFFDDLQVV